MGLEWRAKRSARHNGSLLLKTSVLAFPRRRSDLSAAHGLSGPDPPAVGVELRAKQGESPTLLQGTHGERRRGCYGPHRLKGKTGRMVWTDAQ